MNKTTLRNIAVFIALIGLLFMFAETWFSIDLDKWEPVTYIIAALFVSLGILADTGKEPETLTWDKIKAKLKSRVAIQSIILLILFIVYKMTLPEIYSEILKSVDTVFYAIFGGSIFNNPNAENGYMNNAIDAVKDLEDAEGE